MARGHGNAVLIGSRHSAGTLAIQEFLTRNNQPYAYLDVDLDAEVKKLTNPATATLDYQDIIKNPNISVVYVCTTPEHNHYPITRDCLKAGKHVLLEKPGRQVGQLIGRSPYLQSVHLDAPESLLGSFVDAKILAVGPNSLSGQYVGSPATGDHLI